MTDEIKVDATKEKAVPVWVKELCGLPGENFAVFKKMWDELSTADKDWFRDQLIREGYPVKAA